MRINKFVAQATGMSRRAADQAIEAGRVSFNDRPAVVGDVVTASDRVMVDGRPAHQPQQHTTLMLHKPVGYVVSRDGQGSSTIYDLLPLEYHALKPIGRLDKNSSGLLLLTDDGQLAQQLTHPSHQKQKTYEVTLNADLQPLHRQIINDTGLHLADGYSRLSLERQHDGNDRAWIVRMSEGRNRQIRRTFEALGYRVTRLHRTAFGPYHLQTLGAGDYKNIEQ